MDASWKMASLMNLITGFGFFLGDENEFFPSLFMISEPFPGLHYVFYLIVKLPACFQS